MVTSDDASDTTAEDRGSMKANSGNSQDTVNGNLHLDENRLY